MHCKCITASIVAIELSRINCTVHIYVYTISRETCEKRLTAARGSNSSHSRLQPSVASIAFITFIIASIASILPKPCFRVLYIYLSVLSACLPLCNTYVCCFHSLGEWLINVASRQRMRQPFRLFSLALQRLHHRRARRNDARYFSLVRFAHRSTRWRFPAGVSTSSVQCSPSTGACR